LARYNSKFIIFLGIRNPFQDPSEIDVFLARSNVSSPSTADDSNIGWSKPQIPKWAGYITSVLSASSPLGTELTDNLRRGLAEQNYRSGIPVPGLYQMDVFEFTEFDREGHYSSARSASNPDCSSRSRRNNPIPAGGLRNSYKLKVKLKSKRNSVAYIKHCM
jgi:hypothetical protein